MRSGELAAAAGVNVQTLRYYERRGLLPEPDRSLGGHRDYGADAVRVLRVVKAAQRLGFTLDEITELLAVGRHRGAGLRERARSRLADVDARIADLQAVRATLVDVLDAGCADLVECSCVPGCPIPFPDLGAS
ncbi:MAG TPA: MerR family transcriptional regulator [Pseudonocardia sp.]|nr:MerR family transcriptional regulator [Pseudonocardia sp.]